MEQPSITEYFYYCLLFMVPIFLCNMLLFFPPRVLLKLLDRRVIFTKQKDIHLTIDDAPSVFSRTILESCTRNNIKVTFFLIGENIVKNPDIAQEIANRHSVQNHDFTSKPSHTLPVSKLRSQIIRTDELIESTGAPTPTYFRPASGFYSAKMLSLLDNLQKECVLGDVYAFDAWISFFGFIVPPKVIAWFLYIHAILRVREGSIIIMHDGYKCRAEVTAKFIDYLVPWLDKNNYKTNVL